MGVWRWDCWTFKRRKHITTKNYWSKAEISNPWRRRFISSCRFVTTWGTTISIDSGRKSSQKGMRSFKRRSTMPSSKYGNIRVRRRWSWRNPLAISWGQVNRLGNTTNLISMWMSSGTVCSTWFQNKLIRPRPIPTWSYAKLITLTLWRAKRNSSAANKSSNCTITWVKKAPSSSTPSLRSLEGESTTLKEFWIN